MAGTAVPRWFGNFGSWKREDARAMAALPFAREGATLRAAISRPSGAMSAVPFATCRVFELPAATPPEAAHAPIAVG